MTGIVAGSALFELWSRRRRATQMTFAWTQTFIAVTALGVLIFFPHIPEVLPPILRATNRSFQGLLLAQFLASALVMLPTAIVFGFNFPAVIALIAGRQASASSALVGRAYAWNTMGAIVGAIASGFWLLPMIGAFHLLAAAAAINIALAAIFQSPSSAANLRTCVQFGTNPSGRVHWVLPLFLRSRRRSFQPGSLRIAVQPCAFLAGRRPHGERSLF